MHVHTLLTPAARRHIRLLTLAVLPAAGRIERAFRAVLRERGYNTAQRRALMAITPLAAARASSLKDFLAGVEYHGRRLAKLDMALDEVEDLLARFGGLLAGILKGACAPAREQLHLVTAHALREAWYQVHESEARVFFGLAHAEAESESLDDLLARVVRILTRAFRASAARVLQLENPPKGKLARECYLAGPLPGFEGCAACWSFPARSLALIQLGFDRTYPWLPRESAMLRAVAERCAAAIDRARLQAELARLEAEARCAEEEERRRIGRELHDDTAQSLLLLRLQLEMMERDAPPDWRPRLVQARVIAERSIADLRRTIAALSPALLERLGLESALRQLAARLARRHPVEVRISVSPGWREMPQAAREVVYRVAQESLQNIAKHSGAKRVNLRLASADKKFRLSVSDNGAGFNPERALGKSMSFGLAGMRERAVLLGGTLGVRSRPGKGTTVTLEIPRAGAGGEK